MRRQLVALGVGLLLAVGCGGSDDSARQAATTTPVTTAVPATTSTTFPLSGVDWSSVALPVDCGEGGQAQTSEVVPAQPASDTEVVVVLGTCVAGAGTPPTAALVYDSASSTTEPHLLQTLFDAKENWEPEPGRTTADGPALTMPVYGYSSADPPRCCPDLHPTLTWRWDGGRYVPVDAGPDHRRLGLQTWF